MVRKQETKGKSKGEKKVFIGKFAKNNLRKMETKDEQANGLETRKSAIALSLIHEIYAQSLHFYELRYRRYIIEFQMVRVLHAVTKRR